jgi:hypothetical protein
MKLIYKTPARDVAVKARTPRAPSEPGGGRVTQPNEHAAEVVPVVAVQEWLASLAVNAL